MIVLKGEKKAKDAGDKSFWEASEQAPKWVKKRKKKGRKINKKYKQNTYERAGD